MSVLKNLRLSDDVGLLVYVSGMHIHISVVLILSESSKVFVLYRFVYHESFKVKMFRWELESKIHEAEDEALSEEIFRLRR